MIESATPLQQATLGTLFTWAVTAAGSGLVYLIPNAERWLFDSALGFSAGVMLAASYWSLLAPAIEASENYGAYAIVPSLVGFILGAGFVYASDLLLPHDTVQLLSTKAGKGETGSSKSVSNFNKRTSTNLRKRNIENKGLPKENTSPKINEKTEGADVSTRRIALLILAITIHNIPEGLAVGVSFAAGNFAIARNTAIGIGIQNFPEGLAVSLPLRAHGMSSHWAFFWGQLSGMFEPLAGVAGCWLATEAQFLLPYALAFAAGAMVFVVMDDIIPEVQTHGNSRMASWSVIVGFCVMMTLDVTLG